MKLTESLLGDNLINNVVDFINQDEILINESELTLDEDIDSTSIEQTCKILKSNLSNSFLKTILGSEYSRVDYEALINENSQSTNAVLDTLYNNGEDLFPEDNTTVFENLGLVDQQTKNASTYTGFEEFSDISTTTTLINTSSKLLNYNDFQKNSPGPVINKENNSGLIDPQKKDVSILEFDNAGSKSTINNDENSSNLIELTVLRNFQLKLENISTASLINNVATNFTELSVSKDNLATEYTTSNFTEVVSQDDQHISLPNNTPTSLMQSTDQCNYNLSSTRLLEYDLRNNNLEEVKIQVFPRRDRLFRVLNDMESASRHTKTTIEYTTPSITYMIDKSTLSYCCKNCDLRYQTIMDLLLHARGHGTDDDLIQNIYNAPRNHSGKLVSFVVNHQLKLYQCRYCDDKKYSDSKSLYRHIACHVSDKVYSCDECGKEFRIFRYLSIHKAKHKNATVFNCGKCSKSFKSKESLKVHDLQNHHTFKQFKCDICGKKFAVIQYLKVHQQRHQQETSRVCYICGKILKNNTKCCQHISDKHKNASSFQCEICDKKFPAARNLQMHSKLHGDKTYKCQICGKSFYYKRVLNDHLLIHSGEKPHECSHCGKKFRMLGTLYKHVRIHTGERPFVCEVCKRSFAQLTSLQVHQRIHTKQKPYQCQKCGKSYTQSYIFNQHVKKHH